MVPCPTCGTHAVSDDCTCPHCGSKLCVRRPALKTTAAALLGLSLVGCPNPIVAEPEYGVTVTDYADTDTDTDTDTDETGDTASD